MNKKNYKKISTIHNFIQIICLMQKIYQYRFIKINYTDSDFVNEFPNKSSTDATSIFEDYKNTDSNCANEFNTNDSSSEDENTDNFKKQNSKKLTIVAICAKKI